ncbi:MAG: hypothetical protein ABSD68_04315, partial [Candidatus Micrarchaeales archaeon]
KLEIVYLDNADLFKEYASMEVKRYGLEKHLRKSKTAEQTADLRNALYVLEVEMEYLHHVKREDALVNAMLSQKPEVVIVGLGHSDILWDRFKNGRLTGIKFGSYATEEGCVPDFVDGELTTCLSEAPSKSEEKAIIEMLSERIPPNTLMQDSGSDGAYLAIRDSLERKYCAIKSGRITEEKPDAIGTWDTTIRAKGLFELFITERNGTKVSGTIEDTLGKSTFNGVWESDFISFVKEYQNPAILAGASQKALFYNGQSRNGKNFVGRFTNEDRCFVYDFEMTQFNG